jgi:UDP-N-acetylmuramoyl-tripeptide--D-alanyl-D-alanine ligase
LNYRKNIIPINLKKTLGKSQVYASLAAISLGAALDLSLLDIADSLKDYQSPKGRLKIIKGLKNSLIIDDSYNASDPLSVINGLKILKKTKAFKKIAVISDMLELGKFEKKAHLQVAQKALERANVIFTIGERSKVIHKYCQKNSKIKSHIMKHFENKKDLIKETAKILNKNSVVYVKGSQGMRMEKVVKGLMREPAKAGKLLVRQGGEWLKK